MRIERVALRGFLSHADTDWQPNGARLVSIVGQNGAGKSSMAVDGPLYALFDDARGRTDDLVSLGASDMSARVEFEFAGHTYAVERGRTSRAGGKSYLELQIRDGDHWRPLTGDTIRDTQAAIGALLRMDAKAFTTSVVLGQGHAMAFAETTAAERKRILGQVLDLEVYARAEAEARDQARHVEATVAVSRGQLERVEAAIAELGDVEQDRARALEAVASATSEITAAQARRTAVDARLLELAADLAAGAAAEADVARLDGERASLADRYRREQKAMVDADTAAAAARVTLGFAADVDQAVADLPTMRQEVAGLEEAERQDDALATQVRAKLDAITALERPYEVDHAAWSVRWKDAKKKAGELEQHGRAGTSVCEACGQAINQDTALEQLTAARAVVKNYEAVEPKRPLAIDREKVALEQLRRRQNEHDWDPGLLNAARQQLAELERTAARGVVMDVARASLETATAAAADARAELARITTAGEAIAEQLTAARTKVDGLQSLYDERHELRVEVVGIRDVVEAAEKLRRVAETSVARAEASLERLAQLQAEREALTASLVATGDELAILRQLVVAFGVTGIPARIIESVIPELEGYANELLAELRPGMDLAIRAQRAKKDGKGLVEALDLVVRDAAGERPLAMFSGGERMSVSLAIAVALSRLVARRAGAAIRTLVVDEPDGLDADARRAFGQALRVLAHHGELERVVLVSHHEDLAEFGDATYRVTKNGHGSVVEQV